jgi:hypothetical protein
MYCRVSQVIGWTTIILRLMVVLLQDIIFPVSQNPKGKIELFSQAKRDPKGMMDKVNKQYVSIRLLFLTVTDYHHAVHALLSMKILEICLSTLTQVLIWSEFVYRGALSEISPLLSRFLTCSCLRMSRMSWC